MLSPASCSLFSGILISFVLKENFATAKTQYLFDNDEGSPSISSLSPNYHLSTPKTKVHLNRVPEHLQNIQLEKGANGDVIHIVDPPTFATNKKSPPSPQNFRHIPKDQVSTFKKNTLDEGNLSNHLTNPSYPFKLNRPTATFLIKPQPLSGSNLMSPHQGSSIHYSPNYLKKTSPKLGQFSKSNLIAAEHAGALSYHFGAPQLYPLKVIGAVRHKHIIRTHPNPMIPHAKHRVHFKKFKSFQSKIQQKSFDFEEQAEDVELDSVHTNDTSPKFQTRSRRDTNARHKSEKVMRGNLLPVALTIMGANGELLTGKALLQHITILLKNASTFKSDDSEGEIDFKKFVNKDVLLNEKEFRQIMDNSMNLTDPVMLTVLGMNALNDSSLLTNAYVNDYLNCIDTSKTSNRFKALQNKIDCMKQKMFDRSNFDTADSSRYAISNLPAALVYADVMSNIKNLVRPKNGIAFYSLPVDELTHLQQVVLPIEDYLPPSKINTAQYVPSSYQNRKIYFNERIEPRMPTWYVVKSDGRIYQMEANRSPHPPPIYHGFPDIPNADVFVDGPPPRLPFFESIFFDD